MTRRRPNPIALVFGSGYVALGVLVIAGHVGTLSDTRRVWPAVLVAVGIIMLGGIAGGRRRPPPAPPPSFHQHTESEENAHSD